MVKKVLIAYYSRRGENYVNGSIKNLKLGNTEVVAQKIKALLPDADMFQIDTTYEYSKSYMTCIEEAKQELHDQARPEVKNPLESIDEYDTIILGYPNWWARCRWCATRSLNRMTSRARPSFPSAPMRVQVWAAVCVSSRSSALGQRSRMVRPFTEPKQPMPTVRQEK